jgi:hypothetical protein
MTLGDQRRVDLGLADLDDVQVHLDFGHLHQLLAQLLDVGALLADDHARDARCGSSRGTSCADAR